MTQFSMSLDVGDLYPDLLQVEVVRIIGKLLEDTEICFNNVESWGSWGSILPYTFPQNRLATTILKVLFQKR
jgi:hypothetical protein